MVLSVDGGNSLVLACEWSEILGYFFFFGENSYLLGRLKFIWFVHFVSPFLYTLTLISFSFYTVICYHLLLGVNQLGHFVSLGGYFDDDLAVLCGIAFMDLEYDQPKINFNFCWVH